MIGTSSLAAQSLITIPPAPVTDTVSIQQKFHVLYESRMTELREALKRNNLKETVYDADGSLRQAMYVTPTGHIVYNSAFNIGAGRSISTNKVWPGGPLNVSLTGAGLPNRLGVWDEGRVRSTHQEFGGRVALSDGAATLSEHATHVAGTMVASGVQANAKGMSYAATLRSYDWTNDANEMIQAAQNGMLISNHSYGNITGWRYNQASSRWEWYGDPLISNVEDYKFGLYDERTAEWDEIAMNYPYYLICKAAGNDRGDNKSGSTWYYSNGTQGSGTAPGPDGGSTGYDCISTYGTAKNILTVGAVNKIGGNTGNGWTKVSDVVMSSFSGWGPTDDGRIKPDVVAPGVSIYSATQSSNTSYATLQGTSMATPAVSGSLLLVQQHYHNLKGKFMRSATLKGLAIHTADEAGTSEGPDYRFGWGMFNTASCVRFISDSNTNKFEERSISNGQVQTVQFNADAGTPLRITISWTDRPGTPVSSNLLDNPAKMLVNDLDIRLTRKSDNQVFMPYVLNPASPGSAATTGDNFRDNVEMIHITAPQAGIYTLQITHKGVLSAPQPYSLFISNGVEKSAALFTANRSVICPGQQITFTDASTGGVTSRQWYFPGGTPAASTAASVNVVYPAAGKYPVALKITSALGEDSVYRAGFITVGGLDLPFTEDFEVSSPTLASWSVVNPDLGITWALYGVSGTAPGDRAAGISFNEYGNVGQRDGLVSPPLSFYSHTGNTLTFKHAYTRYSPSSPSDSLVVWVSTNCGSNWTRVASFGENGTGTFGTFGADKQYSNEDPFVPASANEWCGSSSATACKTVSLAAFDGQPSVMIKFEGYNNYGNNLYIDNIEVTGTPKRPVALFGAAKTTVCAGEAVALRDLSEHHPTNWLWTTEGAVSSSSTEQHPLVVYNTPGQYAVTLRASNITGSDSIGQTDYITVVAKPNTPNLVHTGSLLLCTGDSVLLSTDSSNAYWYADDVLIAQNVLQVYAKTSALYRVALSNGVCEASSTANVIVSDKPDVPVITPSVTGTALCPGTPSILTSDAPAGNQWYRNMLPIEGATSRTYAAADSGSYTVVAMPGGCASEHSAPKAYGMNTRPVVGEISGPENPHRDETVNFSVPDQAGHTFQWSVTKGSITAGNNTPTITARFTVVDSVEVSVVSKDAATGCTSVASTKSLYVIHAIGLGEYSSVGGVTVYPVPAGTVLNIGIEGIRPHTSTINVVNVLGQVVLQRDIVIASGLQTYSLDVSSLEKGLYFIELQHAGEKLVKKIIVE